MTIKQFLEAASLVRAVGSIVCGLFFIFWAVDLAFDPAKAAWWPLPWLVGAAFIIAGPLASMDGSTLRNGKPPA